MMYLLTYHQELMLELHQIHYHPLYNIISYSAYIYTKKLTNYSRDRHALFDTTLACECN